MNREIRELNLDELDFVVGGCDSVRECGFELGKTVADAVQDAWNWLTDC